MQGLTAEDRDLIRAKAELSSAHNAKSHDLHSENLIRLAGRGLIADAAGLHPIDNRVALLLKRSIDILGAVFGLIFLSPLFLMVAICIKTTSPGPVFFHQERLGRNGRWFKVWKFRTMYEDAEARLDQLLAEDPSLHEEYTKFHKLSEDPRITRCGSFLRRHSLDELPQLINILRGQMSLVGPRAYLPWEVLEIEDKNQIIKILQVRPGLTGFWQVGGRSNVSFEERVDMEAFYIQHWSIGMDIYLLINTIWLLLVGRGHGAA